jgi:hypothetical protein
MSKVRKSAQFGKKQMGRKESSSSTNAGGYATAKNA